ncbi:putative integral membrane protein (TIGR02327 family) [Thermolongibacillus altinsuensis]|jgi:uncharacterized integral membrane protein (TIGR02327 family)|uniref:Putative integral membrane protein (TIGR02327 family) n=1 Tax=Thermolongibacillus altinsuensis TaxID=575256 RepID=A0A4V6NGI1_9BACL|nr:DUF1146 family protein [Thermolongibacillus altinsuensis]TCL52752.1 putative integral membrane protein (TIGR02327 family) [Thermolongibacillus altinsuensis]GMB09412.1 putative membrane protein YwzB [Thermolongibacillus altinsuensis]
MVEFGQEALISILSHLFFISLTWWTLQAVQLEKIFKPNRIFQARLFYILLTIALGSIVSNFFLDYLRWSRQLPFLF